jgi:hypothetical protein
LLGGKFHFALEPAETIKQPPAHRPFASQDSRVGVMINARLDGGSQDVGEVIGRDSFGLAGLTMEGTPIAGFGRCSRQAVCGGLSRSCGWPAYGCRRRRRACPCPEISSQRVRYGSAN